MLSTWTTRWRWVTDMIIRPNCQKSNILVLESRIDRVMHLRPVLIRRRVPHGEAEIHRRRHVLAECPPESDAHPGQPPPGFLCLQRLAQECPAGVHETDEGQGGGGPGRQPYRPRHGDAKPD